MIRWACEDVAAHRYRAESDRPRLRQARQKKDVTLDELAKATGISKSTRPRLESRQRKPSLKLLLPIVAALAVPLDEIVTSPRIEDPRVPQKSTRSDGRILTPLSQHQGEPQAFKITIPVTEREPDSRTHTGYEWIYVLSGRLRLSRRRTGRDSEHVRQAG